MTYQELDEASDRFAAALTGLGIGRGDRVAYFMQNCPALVVGFYGILKSGAVIVPCNPMYREQELAHQLQDSGARAILCDADQYPIVEDALHEAALETGDNHRRCARGLGGIRESPVHGGTDRGPISA